jgi:hypothetical protein
MALTAYYPTKLDNYIYSDISVPVSIIGPIENGLPGPSDHLPVVYTGNGLKVLSYNTSFVTSYIVNNQKFAFGAGDNVILKYLRLLLAENGTKDIDALESPAYFLMFSEFSRQIVKNFFDNNGGSCAGLQEQNHTTAGVIKTITDICLQDSPLQYQTGSVLTSISTYPTLLTIWDTGQLGSELIPLVSPVHQPPPMYKDKEVDTYGGKYDILPSENCESYVADLGNKATSNIVLRDKASNYEGYGYKNPNKGQDDGRPIMITLVKNENECTLLINFHAPNFPKYVTQTGQGPINIDTSREYVKNLIQAHVMNSLEGINEEEKTKITKVIVMCDSNDTEGKLSLEFTIGNKVFSVDFSTLRVKSCCVNCDSNEITKCSNDIVVPLPSYAFLSKYTTTEAMEKAYNTIPNIDKSQLKWTFKAKNFKFYGDYAAVLVGIDAPSGGRRRFRTKKHRKHHRRITKKRRHRNTKKRHRRNRNHRRSTKH